MTSNFDVVVIGAGPGGSTAAKVCAEEGLRVALLEKNSKPGLKACAGGLEYKVIKEFEIDESVIECVSEWICYCNKKRWVCNKLKSANVFRRKFDNYLAERAVKAGANLFTSTKCVKVIEKGKGIRGVIAKSPIGETAFLGNILIIADGFGSRTARFFDLSPRMTPSDFGVTIQCEVHVRSKVKNDSIYLFYGNDIANCGYGWIYPKNSCYTVGLGCLASEMHGEGLVSRLEYLIKKHPIASKILRDITLISKFEGACVPLKQSDRICSDGVLVVGDAAGQVSALSGSGIYYAMKAGHLAGQVAVDAISKEDVSIANLHRYQELWFSLYGNELKRQKRVLEMLEKNYAQYMKGQIFLGNYPKIKIVTDKSLSLIKRLFYH